MRLINEFFLLVGVTTFSILLKAESMRSQSNWYKESSSMLSKMDLRCESFLRKLSPVP